MAEAIAVVGVVASIVQLVDFSSKVLHRLDEFQSSLGEIPKWFRHIKAELPILQDTLQQTKEAIDAGSVRDETKRALIPVIKGCREQIESLDVVLTRMLPTANDSPLKKGSKAILSLYQDPKVESITKILRGYIGTLTFYYAAASSTLRPLTGSTLLKVYMKPPLNPCLRCKTRQNPPMAISARSINELPESTQTTSTRHRSLVSGEQRIYQVEDRSCIISLAVWDSGVRQNYSKLDYPPKRLQILCR